MVGDSLNLDIKGAQDFGIKTIWINRNNNKAENIKPDYEIANLTEIIKIITMPPNDRFGLHPSGSPD